MCGWFGSSNVLTFCVCFVGCEWFGDWLIDIGGYKSSATPSLNIVNSAIKREIHSNTILQHFMVRSRDSRVYKTACLECNEVFGPCSRVYKTAQINLNISSSTHLLFHNEWNVFTQVDRIG